MRPLFMLAAALAFSGPALAQDGGAGGDYSDFVPTTELYTAGDEPPETRLVQRLYELAFTELCNAAIDGGYGGPAPEVFDFTWRSQYDEASDPERQYRLYQFNCYGGAYNFSSVFYGWSADDGVRALSFATPHIEVIYAQGDTLGEKLEGIEVLGFEARAMIANVRFDEASKTLNGGGYWRGLGDASDYGVWRFREGAFVLETYDVDASYNGEIDPERLVDYARPDDVPAPERQWGEDGAEDEAD